MLAHDNLEFNFLLYSVLFAPNFKFIAFCYVPVYIGNSVYIKLKYQDLSDFEEGITIELIAVHLLMDWIGFYILQERELKRFFQQWEVVKNEQLAIKKE